MLDLGDHGEDAIRGGMRPEEISVGLTPRNLRARGQEQLVGWVRAFKRKNKMKSRSRALSTERQRSEMSGPGTKCGMLRTRAEMSFPGCKEPQ